MRNPFIFICDSRYSFLILYYEINLVSFWVLASNPEDSATRVLPFPPPPFFSKWHTANHSFPHINPFSEVHGGLQQTQLLPKPILPMAVPFGPTHTGGVPGSNSALRRRHKKLASSPRAKTWPEKGLITICGEDPTIRESENSKLFMLTSAK